MIDSPPAADPSSPWMTHLERAHALAHEAARAIGEIHEPSLHLAPAARHLERGIAAMYDAFDGRADRVSAIGRAHGRLWEGAVLVARAGKARALEALRAACAELIAAEERFPRVALAGRAPKPIQAAMETLPLHVIERASIAPVLRAPPEPAPDDEPPLLDLPEPTTFEELAAVAELAIRSTEARLRALTERRAAPRPKAISPEAPPPSGFANHPEEALSGEAFVRRWARQCFEEIGMLGLQRAPLAGDDWRSSLSIERRLLHAVDAVAALGPTAIAYLEPLALDAPVASPMTIFAIALLAGCLEGRDVLGCAERVLHHFGPSDPLVAEPFISAMKLAPSPFVPSMLRALLGSPERGCKVIAVEVLAHRGLLSDAELSALAEDDDPQILSQVLPALATSRHRDLERALGRARGHSDPRVQTSLLDAMALAAHPEAASSARELAAGTLGDHALVRLALVGDEADARWLLSRAKASPTLAAIESLGWAGLLDAVPWLIDVLESGEDDAKLAAGAALERLLGANLVEKRVIAPEAAEEVMLTDPDPDPPKPGPTLAALVSHPRDMPSSGSPEEIDAASIDPAKWEAHWSSRRQTLDAKARIRRGQGYVPSVSLEELDRLPLSPEDRRRLHRELSARTGRVVRFDPHDFVVTQERALGAWGGVVKGMGEARGAWGRAVRR